GAGAPATAPATAAAAGAGPIDTTLAPGADVAAAAAVLVVGLEIDALPVAGGLPSRAGAPGGLQPDGRQQRRRQHTPDPSQRLAPRDILGQRLRQLIECFVHRSFLLHGDSPAAIMRALRDRRVRSGEEAGSLGADDRFLHLHLVRVSAPLGRVPARARGSGLLLEGSLARGVLELPEALAQAAGHLRHLLGAEQ